MIEFPAGLRTTKDLDEDDEGEWGSWERELRANSPITGGEVAEPLPEPLQLWVRRMTQQAADLFESVEEEEPAFVAVAAQLKEGAPVELWVTPGVAPGSTPVRPTIPS